MLLPPYYYKFSNNYPPVPFIRTSRYNYYNSPNQMPASQINIPASQISSTSNQINDKFNQINNSINQEKNFKNNLTNNKDKIPQSDILFEFMGIKIYLDDLIILAILFFLYQEKVKDEMLYIVLILLLFS